eukprot:366380-Chlamydomonas_euryale.AAC.1
MQPVCASRRTIYVLRGRQLIWVWVMTRTTPPTLSVPSAAASVADRTQLAPAGPLAGQAQVASLKTGLVALAVEIAGAAETGAATPAAAAVAPAGPPAAAAPAAVAPARPPIAAVPTAA